MGKDIIGKAFSSTGEGFVGEWTKWILLIVCSLIQSITFGIVPLLNGYILRIFSADNKAPEIDSWGKMFVDGWKFNIVCLLYMIPAIIIAVVFGLFALVPVLGAVALGNPEELMALFGIFTGIAITGVVMLIMALFMFMGLVRLGKTNKIGEAFNFGEITKTIGSGAGWLGYIGYCVLLWILLVLYILIVSALNFIPFLGMIVGIIVTPLVWVFIAYYLKNVYEAKD
ncbi:DUF4013 domain-containing protein [Methanomicrobium antiquum]|uniref:DUF4013 domain-containing protein n=1 Tax=Methanomicrobium antiquum TaxID=487686 RepID=A0AAF0JL68_9EURY|nr:DUF4013 domain-containing protein [Methanomicrobium antiquum]MDD3977557.1 DUF4013 domain-containing protein [Methanomicrobium sp.]WFN35832.1 DUF4013 domain-containing protein [Methanomicrobium antiquum]